MQDPERFFTVKERRALLKRKNDRTAEAQRNLEDDFWWIEADFGGSDW